MGGAAVLPATSTRLARELAAYLRRHGAEPGPGRAPTPADVAEAAAAPWSIEAEHVRWWRWREALAALTDRSQQQVIGYRYVDRAGRSGLMPQEEVAARLGRSVRWVAHREKAALHAMARWLVRDSATNAGVPRAAEPATRAG